MSFNLTKNTYLGLRCLTFLIPSYFLKSQFQKQLQLNSFIATSFQVNVNQNIVNFTSVLQKLNMHRQYLLQVVTGASVVKSNILAQQLMTTQTSGGVTTPRQVVIRQAVAGSTPTVQKIVSAGGSQVVMSTAQVFTTPSGQQVILQGSGTNPTGQLVIGGRVINGQQVLIRGPNNTLMTLAGTPAQGKMIVKTVASPGGQKILQKQPVLIQKAPTTILASTTTTNAALTPIVAAVASSPQVVGSPVKEAGKTLPALVAATAGQAAATPPKILGTPTAQVIQTPNGPSIILQGLKGNFTEQQLNALKEQVKQHVLKQQANKAAGNAAAANTMVVSMPAATATVVAAPSASVSAQVVSSTVPQTIVKTVATPVLIAAQPAKPPVIVKQQTLVVPEQPKVVVQTVQTAQPDVKAAQPAEQQPPLQQVARQVLVNGQTAVQPEAPTSPPGKNGKGQFVVTPDYIQQSKFYMIDLILCVSFGFYSST